MHENRFYAKEALKVQKMTVDFWKHGEIISAADNIVLRKLKESDRDEYLKLQKEYALIPRFFDDELFCSMLWEEHNKGS